MIGDRFSSPSATGAGDRGAARVGYTVGALGFMAFAVWGSLFPFDFRPVAAGVVWSRLWAEVGAGAPAFSLTDFVSNVLLFVPIGLLLVAAAEKRWPRRNRWLDAAVFLAAVALSAAVESGQAFVSSRTPSFVDVVAKALGAASGIVAWRTIGSEIDALVLTATAASERGCSSPHAARYFSSSKWGVCSSSTDARRWFQWR